MGSLFLPVANDLTGLGQVTRGAQSDADAARHRDAELASHLLQSVAQNRLAQQQLAQSSRRDNMQTAIALAQLQDQNAQRDLGFTHALALQKADNDAKLDMLSKQLSNALEVAKVNASRTDPRLFGDVLGQNYQATDTNRTNDALASAANQELATLNLQDQQNRAAERDEILFPSTGGYPSTRHKTRQEALDLKYQQGINAILAKYQGKLLYDPTAKAFKPVVIPPVQIPYRNPFGANGVPAPTEAVPATGTTLAASMLSRPEEPALGDAAFTRSMMGQPEEGPPPAIVFPNFAPGYGSAAPAANVVTAPIVSNAPQVPIIPAGTPAFFRGTNWIANGRGGWVRQ